MKKLILILVLAFAGLAACKKDETPVLSAFDKISYADIKAKEGRCVAYLVIAAGTETVIDSPLGLPKRAEK